MSRSGGVPVPVPEPVRRRLAGLGVQEAVQRRRGLPRSRVPGRLAVAGTGPVSLGLPVEPSEPAEPLNSLDVCLQISLSPARVILSPAELDLHHRLAIP